MPNETCPPQHPSPPNPKKLQSIKTAYLSVKAGEIFSLLGQNGAGKSTLIKILTTFLIPTFGKVTMLGKDIVKQATEVALKLPVSSYSGSVKRRLDIALNMMSNPKILFLDEPTTGLDIQSRIRVGKMMRKIRNDFGTTIFLTTHYLEEADHLSDTICIMKDGKDLIQGTPMKLRSFIRQDSLQVQFSKTPEAQKYLIQFREHF